MVMLPVVSTESSSSYQQPKPLPLSPLPQSLFASTTYKTDLCGLLPQTFVPSCPRRMHVHVFRLAEFRPRVMILLYGHMTEYKFACHMVSW